MGAIYNNNINRPIAIKLTGQEIIDGVSSPYSVDINELVSPANYGNNSLTALLDNQDEIQVVRRIYDYSAVSPLPTSAEMLSLRTLPNSNLSGSTMYTISGTTLTFSQDAADYVWTTSMSGRGADVQLPGIVAGDIIYIMRKNVLALPIVRFQPGSRFTASSLNMAIDQVLYIAQEVHYLIENFGDLNPVMENLSEGICFLDAGGYLQSASFNVMSTYINAGNGLVWTTETAGSTTADLLDISIANAGAHGTLQFISGGLSLNPITAWTDGSFSDTNGSIRSINATLAKGLKDQQDINVTNISALQSEVDSLTPMHYKGTLDVDGISDDSVTEPSSPTLGDTYDIVEAASTDDTSVDIGPSGKAWNASGGTVTLTKGDQLRWDGTLWRDVFHSPFVRLDGTSILTADWDTVGDTNTILVTTQAHGDDSTKIASTAHVKDAMDAQTTMAALTTANALINATSLASLPALVLTTLSDVAAAADDTTGNFLKWSGSAWVGDNTVLTTASSIESLGDVASFSPGSGEVLTWNGSAWAAAAASAGSTASQLISGANADGVTDDAALVQTKLDLIGTPRDSTDAQSTPTMKSTLDLQGRTFMVQDGLTMWGNSNITIQNGTLNHKHPTSSFGSCIHNSNVWGSNTAGYYSHTELEDKIIDHLAANTDRQNTINSTIGVEALGYSFGAGSSIIRVEHTDYNEGDYIYIHEDPEGLTGSAPRLSCVLGSSEMGTAYRGEWNVIERISSYIKAGDSTTNALIDTDGDGSIDSDDIHQVDTTLYFTLHLRHPLRYEYRMGDSDGTYAARNCRVVALRTLTNTTPGNTTGASANGLAQHNIVFKNVHIKETAHRFLDGNNIWENYKAKYWNADGSAADRRYLIKPTVADQSTDTGTHSASLYLGWNLKLGNDTISDGEEGDMLTTDVGAVTNSKGNFPKAATRWTNPVIAMNGVVPTGLYETLTYDGDRREKWDKRWDDFNNTELFLARSPSLVSGGAYELFAQIFDSDYKHQKLYDGAISDGLNWQLNGSNEGEPFTMVGSGVSDGSAYDDPGEKPWNPGVISLHCNAGIHYKYAYDLVFEDCVFEGNAYGGVVLDGCTNAVFRNCTFRNSRWANVQDPSKGAGIILNGCEKVLIEGCTFENCNSGVVLGGVNTYALPMGNPDDTTTVGIKPKTERQHCADITITNCVFDGVSRGVVNQNSLTMVIGMTISDCVFQMRPGNESIFHFETTGFSSLDPEAGIAARGISLNGHNITLRGNQIHGSVNYGDTKDTQPLRKATGAWGHTTTSNPHMLSATDSWPFGLSQEAIDIHMSDNFGGNSYHTSHKNIASCDIAIQVCIQGQPMLAYEGYGVWGSPGNDQLRREENEVLPQSSSDLLSWGNLYKQSFGCVIEDNSVEAFGTGIFVVPRNQRTNQDLTGGHATPMGFEMGVVKGISINNNKVKANLHGIQVWAGSPSLARVMDIQINNNNVLFGGFIGYVPGHYDTTYADYLFIQGAPTVPAIPHYPTFHNFAGNLFDFGGYPVNASDSDLSFTGIDRNKLWDAETVFNNTFDPIPHAPSGIDGYKRYNRFSKHEFYKPRFELNALAPCNSTGIMINVVRETERDLWGTYGGEIYPSNYIGSDQRCLVQDVTVSGNTVNANFRAMNRTEDGIASHNMKGCIQLGVPISAGYSTEVADTASMGIHSIKTVAVSNNICRGFGTGDAVSGFHVALQTGIGIPFQKVVGDVKQYTYIFEGIFTGNLFTICGPETIGDAPLVSNLNIQNMKLKFHTDSVNSWTSSNMVNGSMDSGGLAIHGWSGTDMTTWRPTLGGGVG